MSSSRSYRRSNKKSKKNPKKSQSAASNSRPNQRPKSPPPGSSAKPQKPVFIDDDDDDEQKFRKILPYYFRPASIKLRKKQTAAIRNTAANHRRSKSLPSIPIADEVYEPDTRGKFEKLTTAFNMDDVEVIDYRCDDDSEDELLQIWYEEAHLKAQSYHSADESKPKIKSFADVSGHKAWLNETIAEPYASDTTLRDWLTRPYFDAECESFKRQNWIKISHERATRLPRNRKLVFKVLTKNCPRNVLTHLRLGFCVTYAGPCPFGHTCQNYCSSCGICRHQYHCSCRKDKRFGWCWHMHAAILTVKYAFKEKLTVYVSNSSRYMQLAHIRASCYSQQSVTQMEKNLFMVHESAPSAQQLNVVNLVRRLVGQQKCKCPRYKRCPECVICRHKYSCDCIEYEDGNLCEHCHLVAMHLSGCAQDNGEFYYFSDCSDDEEDEPTPATEATEDEQIRQISMIHEHSNSIRLKRVEAFLEPPDFLLCFFMTQHGGEEPWFIEHYGLDDCNCRDLDEAIMCPYCHLCDHEMSCYCPSPEGYGCKHMHATKRFLKVQFNARTENRFDDEAKKIIPDRLLLETRHKRETKRQMRQNRSHPIQNIDLTWNGRRTGAAKNVTESQCTQMEAVVTGGFAVEKISQGQSSSSKIAQQNEARLVDNRSQKDEDETGRDDSFSHKALTTEIKVQAPVSVEKAVESSNPESKIQNTEEVAENLIVGTSSLTASSTENLVINEKSKIPSALESSYQPDYGTNFEDVDSKRVSLEKDSHKASSILSTSSSTSTASSIENLVINEKSKFSSALESRHQPDYTTNYEDVDSKGVPLEKDSHKASCILSDEAKLEKLIIQKVVRLDPTVKPRDSTCEEGTFQQDLCEEGHVTIEPERLVSQSTEATKFKSEILADEPENPRTIKTCGNRADVSTQTEPPNSISVSTQTSDIDFADAATSYLGTAMESKKKRKTKTQRKHLKQLPDNSTLPRISNEDSASEIGSSQAPLSGSSIEMSENIANESKELGSKT